LSSSKATLSVIDPEEHRSEMRLQMYSIALERFYSSKQIVENGQKP